MLENKHEILHNRLLIAAGTAAVIGGAVIRDYMHGSPENAGLRTETELLTNEVMDAEHTVVWFAGCMQDGKDSFKELMQHAQGINLIVPRLPQWSPTGLIDQEEVSKLIIEQFIKTRTQRPVLIGDSRGLLDAVALVKYAHQTGSADTFGGFGKIIGNASPHDGQDITDSRRRLLFGAKLLQHFASPNTIKPFFMKLAGHESSAAATLSETALAGRSIQKSPAVNPIPAIFEELIYVRSPYASDPTVHTKAAAAKYLQDSPPGMFREYIDEARGPQVHVGDTRRYPLLMKLAGIDTNNTSQDTQYRRRIRLPSLQAA